jgi:plasmid stabilization system protein ParE
MTLEFLPEAAAEFYEAAEQYEFRQEGLGVRFRGEVLEVCRLIVQQPLLWRESSGGYRRVNCPVFPYYVAYFIRRDLVLVAAVGHGHRHPDYWKDRLPKE